VQASCSLKAGLWSKPIGLVQRSAATWRCGLHSSPRALVTTVVSRVVLRRVRNCRSYYYYYYYYETSPYPAGTILYCFGSGWAEFCVKLQFRFLYLKNSAKTAVLSIFVKDKAVLRFESLIYFWSQLLAFSATTGLLVSNSFSHFTYLPLVTAAFDFVQKSTASVYTSRSAISCEDGLLVISFDL